MKKLIMRTIALALIASASISKLSAQDSKLQYRVEVGFGLSQINNYGTASNLLFAPRVSGQVLYNFSKSFGLSSGLGIVNKGEKHQFFYDGGRTYVTSGWYFQLPLQASYRVDLNTDNRVYIEAGPYLAFGLVGKQKNKASGDAINLFENDRFNRLEYGLGLSFAYNYRNLYFRLGYENSLSKVVNPNGEFASRVAGGNSAYGLISLGVGYQF